MKAFGSRLATEIAAIIWEAAQKVPHCPLNKIWLYGSIAEAGMGRDIDLILEVSTAGWEKYSRFCHSVLGGVRPFSNDMLEQKHNAVYDYSLPKGDRSMAALKVIGLNISDLNLGVLEDSVDIICLPEGWDVVGSSVHRDLSAVLARTTDKDFFEHVMSAHTKLFPQT